LRSIRFSLQHRDIFDQQLRAILRAGAHSERLGIMFPMISSIDEFQAARKAVLSARDALEAEGLEFHRDKDFIPFLIGIGVRRLSVDPQFLPVIQKEIHKIDTRRAQVYVKHALAVSTLSEMKDVNF
jgi:phosphoenolpyruvate-protein kinase (PTS system EI component)